MFETIPRPSLVTKEFRTLAQITGPLIFVDRIADVAYNEMVEVVDPQGNIRLGQVLEVDRQRCMVRLFVGTSGLDLDSTRVRFTGDIARLDVSLAMLGRVLDGSGKPIDDGPPLIPEASLDINGLPINPAVRTHPSEFIQTGIAAIDGLNTLTRGQKLPIFSGAGLPANELAAQIAAQASVLGSDLGGREPFAVVFAAIGITHREATFFMDQFRASEAMDRTVLFINRADDPSIERLLTPRAALTAAEYLAFTHHRHVLIILTDMTNYCEAFREISAASEEVPGRRGYPGYMYSDLASLYERAGRIRDNPGSLTQLIILTMPDDDITHPIPDLTGYITEGQIVLNRDLHRKGIYPPIDVLPSLSRLMNAAIGDEKTRGDHRYVADQLYSLYAEGRDLRRLVAIVGEAALSTEDQRVLAIAEQFELTFINQGKYGWNIQETLTNAWCLLGQLPAEKLKRIPARLARSLSREGLMQQVSVTRLELLARKAQIVLAQQGRDLLEQKRTALMDEILRIADTVLERSDVLQEATSHAYLALARAEAVAGPEIVRSTALATRTDFPLAVTSMRVMGLQVPHIEQKRIARPALGRGYTITDTSLTIDETAEAFEVAVESILQLAESELRLTRLVAEIQRTSRRLNALEQILLPRLETEHDFIQMALDEREREDHFGLKLVKRLLERKRANGGVL